MAWLTGAVAADDQTMMNLRSGTVKRISWLLGGCAAPLLVLGSPVMAHAASPAPTPVEGAAGISTDQMTSIRHHLTQDYDTAADAKVTLVTQDVDGGVVRSTFAVGAVADAAKTSNPFEVPTMTTFARSDGTVLVRTYRAITASEGAAEEGVVLSPTSYVLASDGTIAGVAPPGGALHVHGQSTSRVQKRTAGFHASQSTTLLVVHCWFVVWDPELQLDYAFNVFSEDYINCDAPGDLVDTVALWSWFNGLHGNTTRYSSLTAGPYGWQYSASRRFYCNLVTGGDYYWTQQQSTVWIPGFSPMGANQFSPNTPYIQCL